MMKFEQLSRYPFWVMDLDGTLYAQMPVRLCMARDLLLHYLFRPRKIKDLFLILDYRRLREHRFGGESADFEEAQIRYLAEKYQDEETRVRDVLSEWMLHRPLSYLARFSYSEVIDLVKDHRAHGGKVVIYSDYPVSEKLESLDFRPDDAFYSGDERILCMKPDPQGLQNILRLYGVEKKDALYIGDREEKDGRCAAAVGVEYLDVKELRKLWKRRAEA